MISIICPVYNIKIELFANTIACVLAQSYTDFEFLVIDDGSNKACADYLDSLKKLNDSRIKIHHKINSGVSAARNFGLDIARGEYIAFVDDDDDIPDFFLESAYNIAQKTNADIIYGFLERISVESTSTKTDFQVRTRINHTDNEAAATLDSTDNSGVEYLLYKDKDIDKVKMSLLGYSTETFGKKIHTGPCARLFSKRVIGDTRFPIDLKYNEDNIFNRRVLSKAGKVAVCDEIWYYYLQNAQSAVNTAHKNPQLYYEQIINFWNQLYDLNQAESAAVQTVASGNAIDLYTVFIYNGLLPSELTIREKIDYLKKLRAHKLIQSAINDLKKDSSFLSRGQRIKFFFIKRRLYLLLLIFAGIWRKNKSW